MLAILAPQIFPEEKKKVHFNDEAMVLFFLLPLHCCLNVYVSHCF